MVTPDISGTMTLTQFRAYTAAAKRMGEAFGLVEAAGYLTSLAEATTDPSLKNVAAWSCRMLLELATARADEATRMGFEAAAPGAPGAQP